MIERKEHIKQTILWLENRKQQLSDKIIEVELCVDTLMQLMGYKREEAETKKTNPQNQKMIPGEINKPKRPYKRREVTPKPKRLSKVRVDHIAGLRGPRNQNSRYKGVSLNKPKKDGTQKFRVQFWNGKLKKNIPLGTFNSELKAAAVYQDHIGNKDEAAKLHGQARQQQADMAEQAENNPDRPPAKKKGKKIWVCKRCGLKYRTDPTKHSCIKCQHKDFREVEMSGG